MNHEKSDLFVKMPNVMLQCKAGEKKIFRLAEGLKWYEIGLVYRNDGRSKNLGEGEKGVPQ